MVNPTVIVCACDSRQDAVASSVLAAMGASRLSRQAVPHHLVRTGILCCRLTHTGFKLQQVLQLAAVFGNQHTDTVTGTVSNDDIDRLMRTAMPVGTQHHFQHIVGIELCIMNLDEQAVATDIARSVWTEFAITTHYPDILP
jgi:hypothetical protein